MVLPPGEFNSIISEPLPVCCESVALITLFSRNVDSRRRCKVTFTQSTKYNTAARWQKDNPDGRHDMRLFLQFQRFGLYV